MILIKRFGLVNKETGNSLRITLDTKEEAIIFKNEELGNEAIDYDVREFNVLLNKSDVVGIIELELKEFGLSSNEEISIIDRLNNFYLNKKTEVKQYERKEV